MAFNELFTFSTTATVDDTYTSPFYVVVGWYDVAGNTTDLDTVLTTNDNTADNANNLTYWRVRVADDSGTYDANTPSTYQEYGAGDGALDDVTDSGNTVADLSSYEENYDGVTPGYKLSFRWQDEFPYFYIDYRDAGTDVKGCVTTIAEPPTLTHETSAGANDGTVTFAIAESPGSTTGYEFSLDQNTWQSSPTFSSLSPGIYNGYARKTSNTSCNDDTTFEILASTADISANFGVKWRLEFQSYRDETIRVDIEEQNYSGSIDDTIQATARPCIFEYGVQNGNIYDVIRGSRVTIGLISETNQEFTSIGQSNFQKYRVSIYIDTALEWRGFVLPEEYREPYVRNAYRISLVATDGLAYLANYDFAGGTTPQGGNRILGLRKQLDIIRICLNKLDLDLNVRTCVNLYEITDAPVTETNDPFNDYYVRADGYYNTSDEDGVNRTAQGAVDPGEALSCLEVLQRILQPYGAYIVQTEGSWQILQADEKRATFTRRLYNASGVYQTFDEYNPLYTLNDAATYETGDATADAHYINAGATLEIIPARGYQKINRVYGLADSILIGGRFGYSDFIDSSTLKSWSAVNVTVSRKPVSRQDFSYALAIAGGASTTAGYVQSQAIDVNGSTDDRLLIRFSYYMNAFVAGTSEDPKVRVQIQYGSYYLEAANGDAFPTWSTSSNKFIDQPVPLDQYRKWQNYEVTTSNLPAAGDNDLVVRIYQGINPVNGFTAEDRVEEIQIQDFEIIYLPDGDFGTEEDYIEEFNNTYVTRGDEITLYHLDAPDDVGNANNIYLNAFYRDSSGTATNAWYRKGYAEEVPISELLLRRIMNNYATPLQRISGMEIRATGAMPRPHYRVTDPQQSSKKFVIPYMLGDIRSGDYTIELHEIAAEDAVVPSVDGYGYERETDREFNILLETGFVLLLEDQTDATYTPPGLITDLTATADVFNIDLAWTGSYKVKIYRSTSTFTDVGDATLIDTTGTAGTTYTDTGLSGGTTYYYRIVPFNDAGDGPASNVASASTVNAFIITVDPDGTGTSGNTEFTLPISGATDLDIYNADTGVLIQSNVTPASRTVDFGSTANINIAIVGTLVGWAFSGGGDRLKLLSVQRWGIFSGRLGYGGAFWGCGNFTSITATDTLYITGNCISMMRDTQTGTSDISGWITTGMTNCVSMFENSNMNSEVNDWDMSSVTTVQRMFQNNRDFRKDINNWDMSSCTSIESMFSSAVSYNGNMNWTTTQNIQLMQGVHFSNLAFNQALSNWDFTSVTTMNGFLANNSISAANYAVLMSRMVATLVNTGFSFSAGSSKYDATQTFSGTTDGTTANELVDSGTDFTSGTAVLVGDVVYNTIDGTYARVTDITNAASGRLVLDTDIMVSGEGYSIQTSQAAKDKAELILDFSLIISDGGYNV